VRHPIQELRGELLNVVELLEQKAFYTLSAEEAQARMEQAQTLLQKIDSIEGGFLMMGLLGGTGVGKSTLMNGLAGAQIASASHRRPHTDRVLIYRHAQANPLPPLTLTDIPWQEIKHEGPGAENIVLCDLPDFDSLMSGHRETVNRFLEQLDLLIWVTSPEKYADRRFYEFLEEVPKAQANFWFVLNKADLFFEGVPLRAGYENMDGAARRFRQHVHANGIAEPIIFVLSARDALGGHETTPWNQFNLFKEQVFQQRDSKTVAAAKAANVDAEVQRYLSGFRSEVRNLECFQEIIRDCRRELQEERAARSQSVGRVLDAWLAKDIRQMIPASPPDFAGLVGPGNSLALLFHRSRAGENGERQRSDEQTPGVSASIPGFVSGALRRELESIADRLHHRLLRRGLPTPLRDRLSDVLDIEERLQELEGAFVRVVGIQTVDSAAPRFPGFRLVQHLTYFLLLAFLLIAIGGEVAWRQFVMEFGLRNAFLLLLAMTQTIFSTKGLAALSSYALLNFFFAFRFYRRYTRGVRRRQERQLETLETALREVWQDELDRFLNDLNRLGEAIQATKAVLAEPETEDGIHDAEPKS
jgi:GTP-binding protein EngB required for normal cell division